MEVNQYQLVLVNLDPTVGSEIKKTRPCLIISPNEMNAFIDTVIVAPITSVSKNYPTRLFIKQKKISGWIVLDQIRTIDKNRIVKSFEVIDEKDVVGVKAMLKEMLVD